MSKLVTPVNGALPYASILDFRFLRLPVSMAGCISVIVGLLILLTQSPAVGAEQARPTGGRVQQSRREPGPESVERCSEGERHSSSSTKYVCLIG